MTDLPVSSGLSPSVMRFLEGRLTAMFGPNSLLFAENSLFPESISLIIRIGKCLKSGRRTAICDFAIVSGSQKIQFSL
jgi:hypothetical protein